MKPIWEFIKLRALPDSFVATGFTGFFWPLRCCLFYLSGKIAFILCHRLTARVEGFQTNANAGRDYAQGLMSLLRRNISAKRYIAGQHGAEWKKSCGQAMQPGMKPIDQTTVVSKVEDALAQNQADPVKAYNSICKLLSKRN